MPAPLKMRFIACLFAISFAAAAPAPIRVLLVDGQNNHDWETTSAWLETLLRHSGRFVVTRSTTPAKGAAAADWAAWRPRFSDYQVVLSNFNGGHLADADRWPTPVESAFVSYVRGGGGFVSLHAANNAFLGWTAYNEIVGLLWRDRQFGPGMIVDDAGRVVVIRANEGRDAGHPPRMDFVMVTLPTNHPITRGFPVRWLQPSEQLTHGQRGPTVAVDPNVLTVLTYARDESLGENEPMDWVRNYGRGRVYVTMLGHTWKKEANPNLRSVGFQTLLLRGLEWAATGRVTIPIPADFPTESHATLRDP